MFAKKNEFSVQHPELKSLWRNKFRQMIRYSSDRTFPIVKEFLSAPIKKVKETIKNGENIEMPILVCVLRNDLGKVRFFMEHYRKIGIKKFVFVDNGSTDGTYEFLLEQEDVTLYQCLNDYTSNRKIAWINRVLAECGDNKWYMLVDSDEFFTYLGEDKYSITDLLRQAEKMNLKRLGVVHLDMYPQGNLFTTENKENFIEKYCFFDKNSYICKKTPRGVQIFGGPRKRIFGTNMKVSGLRCVYFENDDVIPSSHFMIPYEKSDNVPTCLISRHYKFVNEEDYNKIIEAVKTEKYSNNSAEYKTYFKGISKNPELSFYDEAHSIVFSEENLRKMEFIDDIFEVNQQG